MVSRICSCGKRFTTYPSKIKIGKGKFCSKECADKSFIGKSFSPSTVWKKGTMPWNFKGYRYTKPREKSGRYILIYKPNHPYATKSGHVREHRLVMEQQLGRYLLPEEVVHHKDGNTLNNAPNNLEVMLKVDHDRMNTPLNVHRRWRERGDAQPS